MQNAIHEQIADQVKAKGRVKICVFNADGSLAEEQEVDILVVTVGQTAIANQFVTGSPSPPTLRVNKIALGTGTNSPALGDTTLQTETFRKNTASANNVANVATVTGYFTAAETSGTYREAALFINGTGTVDTGTMLSRVAINVTKTTAQTMTIEWTLTIA